MNKDPLITLPNKHLRQRSRKVKAVTKELKKLIATMEKTTLDWEDSRKNETGVALAAVQVNHLIRLVVIRNTFEDKADRTFKTYINPKIVKYEGELVEDFEGCLSITDIYGKVPRYSKVRVRALDDQNQPVKLTAEGFLARVFQHEIDHTQGVLFIDHIKAKKDAFFKLNKEGKLIPLDYEKKIKKSRILW